jgi:ATP-dependent RNA helicase RhlE
VRALVVTPTRELCAQVEESIRTYGKYISLKSITVYGGVGINPQIDALRRGVDILVATPGRLLDHVQQKTVDLRQVEILVLDEADRMLDMGFIHDIRKILALLPQKRQNLLFSATFPDEIRKLASAFMKDPVTIEVARRNTPAELVSQVQHPVDATRKRELLAHLVKTNDWKQVLVFCKTKHGANRLAQQLSRDGVHADAIHGNKSQNARERALEEFKEGKVRVLVATDIAARGLDIEALPHVVNYDMPHVAEDYVHRIGRTGRAGVEGEAVSLVSHEDRPLMAAIERLINRNVESRVIEGFQPGTASSRPPEPRQQQQRGERQQPRGGQRGQRPERHARQARPGNGQQQRPGNGQQQRPGNGQPPRAGGPKPWQDRSASRPQTERDRHRGQGFQRRNNVPAAPVNPEYQAQVEEARKRMREEGEQPAAPAPSQSPRRRERAVPALFGKKSEVPEQQ